MAELPVVPTPVDLWRHLVFDHGADVRSSKRGDPVLMHNAAHAFPISSHVHPACDCGRVAGSHWPGCATDPDDDGDDRG